MRFRGKQVGYLGYAERAWSDSSEATTHSGCARVEGAGGCTKSISFPGVCVVFWQWNRSLAMKSVIGNGTDRLLAMKPISGDEADLWHRNRSLSIEAISINRIDRWRKGGSLQQSGSLAAGWISG